MVHPLIREAKGALKARVPSRVWRAVRERLGQRTTPVTLATLDAKLAECAEVFARSHDEGLRLIRGFHLELADVELPSDPLSDAYRDAQLALFEKISGRAYSTELEHTPVNLDAVPYPYFTGSPQQVGDQLIAIGHLLKSLAPLGPPARVVEFGPGWGNTTLALAQTGFHVTAVDVNPQFLELIRRRVGGGLHVELVRADMLSFTPREPVDAVVFFESFHHCADPLRFIERLHAMVKPGGRVLFASEPIDDFAMPWGVRFDGESVWAMRKNGWLELGFETSFFLAALKRAGFQVTRERSHALTSLTDVIVALR